MALVGAEDLDVGIVEAGASEPGGHSFCSFGGTAYGFGGVDFDELLEDAAGHFAGFGVEHGASSGRDRVRAGAEN